LSKKEYGIQRPADQRELNSFRLVKAELAKKGAIVVCAGIPEISNFSSLFGSIIHHGSIGLHKTDLQLKRGSDHYNFGFFFC
jgi:hypothetical protein